MKSFVACLIYAAVVAVAIAGALYFKADEKRAEALLNVARTRGSFTAHPQFVK